MGDYWFKSRTTLRDHPKTKKLTRLLDVHLAETIGTLNCLWWWAIDYADLDTGDIGKYTPDEIADACEWHGDPDKLIKALVKSRFLDDEPSLRIHGWEEHLGALNVRRIANRDSARASYQRSKAGEKALAEAEAISAAQEQARCQETLDWMRSQAQSVTSEAVSGTRTEESGSPEERRTRQGSSVGGACDESAFEGAEPHLGIGAEHRIGDVTEKNGPRPIDDNADALAEYPEILSEAQIYFLNPPPDTAPPVPEVDLSYEAIVGAMAKRADADKMVETTAPDVDTSMQDWGYLLD